MDHISRGTSHLYCPHCKTHCDAFIKRAREHVDGGDGYEAREELMAMERRYPDISRGGETSLLIAESFYVDGNYGRAEGWVRILLEWKPDCVEAWELLAEILSMMVDRVDELEEVVAHTLGLCPESFAVITTFRPRTGQNRLSQDIKSN